MKILKKWREPARRPIRFARWASNFCLATGLLAMLVCGFVWTESHLFQEFASRYFNLEVSASAAQVHPENVKPAPAKLANLSQPIKENSLIGKLTINRLALSVMVLEGVGDQTLRIAAGHVPDTALPGQDGNVAIAAHRDTFFRSLRNIRPNDTITLETTAGSFKYKVESTGIVDPQQIEVLDPTPYPALTLITCYPFYFVGNAPNRFIVRAREVAHQPNRTSTSNDIHSD